MSIGNEIIITADPRGVFLEGIVYGTPLPGSCMQIKSGTAAVGGRLTYEAFDAGLDGDRRLIAVLLADSKRGGTADTALVSGDRCELYCPIAGEELNMRVSAAGTGTGDSVAVADLLIVNDGDGLLIATTGTPESEPFIAIEAITDVVSTGTLVACIYTGH